MKKLTAILLTAVLLVSMCVVAPLSASAVADYSAKPFWITHYNEYKEAAGCIFTETDQGGTWGIHIAFAPIEGANAFEIVEISNGVGVGTATTLEVPEGGFVYAMEEGNDYDDLAASDPTNFGYMAGWGNFKNPGCNETMAMVQTWAVGDRFAFDGLDLEGSTVPTTTPEVLWYNDSEDGDEFEYVCTATATPFITYEETQNILANGDAEYGVAYGFTFDIDYVNGSLVGEDVTLITTNEAYANCNPNWAIVVVLEQVEGELYEVVSVVPTPGNATSVTLEEGQVALVVHSSTSNPNDAEAYPNWEGKVVALALKAGDKVQVTDTFAYVLRAGDVIETEEEDPGQDPGEPEESLKDIFEAINGDRINDGVLDVILDAPTEYKAGDKITVTATVKNITAEGGIHLLEFVLRYDADQLQLLNDILEDEDHALDCITNVPEGFENLSNVSFTNVEGEAVADNDGLINVSLVTFDDLAAVEDGDIVLTFEFEAKEDASEETGAIVRNDEVFAAQNIPMSDQYPNGGIAEFNGNGSYVILAYNADAEGDEGGEVPTPGDATNAIVFAIVALVSVMGTAIVVKNRK